MTRGERTLFRFAIVVVAIAILVPLGGPLLGRGVFHAADMLRRLPPWNSESSAFTRSQNPFVSDTVNAVIPMRAELQRRVHDGDYPMWTPYPNGGTPLGYVPNQGPLAPLNLPYLLTPVWYAPALAKLLELIVAVTFTALFLRLLGLARPAAVYGGLIFAFCGFQIVWTNWPQTHVAALIPVLFWATERALQRRTMRAAIPLALAVTASVFEGFPALTIWSLLGAGIYALARLIADRDRAPREQAGLAAKLTVAVLLGLALSAIQLLPLADHLGNLDLEYRVGKRGEHLPLHALLTAAVPNAFGSPTDRVYTSPEPFIRAQSFLGAGALLLAWVALMRRTPALPRGVRAGLGVTAGFVAVLVYVGGAPLAAFQTLPMMGTNAVVRMRVLMQFAVAAFAAIGLHSVMNGDRADRRRALVVGLLGVALGGVVVGTSYDPARQLLADAGKGYILRAWLPAVVGVSLVGVAVLLARRWRSAVAWVALPVAAAEAVLAAVPFWPVIPREHFYPVTAAHRFVLDNIGSDRIAPTMRTMEPGATTYYGIRSAAAHAFTPPSWSQALRAVDPATLRHRTFPMLPATEQVATSTVLDRLAARYLVAAADEPVFGPTIGVPRGETDVALRHGRPVRGSLTAGRLRAVAIRLLRSPDVKDPFAALHARVLDGSGDVVARGARRLLRGTYGGRFEIAVLDRRSDNSPPRALTVELELRGRRTGVAVASEGSNRITLGGVMADRDGLDLVFAQGASIYRRTRALPRIRWASRAVAVVDEDRRLDLLRRPLPANTVLLSRPGPSARGAHATLRTLRDGGDEIFVEVRAPAPGYLVVMDSMQTDWVARIDGRPVELVDADHAGVAVAVPAGAHAVEIRYRPPAWRIGATVSSLAALALVVLLVVGRGRARRQGTPVAEPAQKEPSLP